MKWIHKGRSIVSDDGRWRISRVFHTWDLYDRGTLLCAGYATPEHAMNKIDNELRFEAQRRAHV